jgi:hypothetical protein
MTENYVDDITQCAYVSLGDAKHLPNWSIKIISIGAFKSAPSSLSNPSCATLLLRADTLVLDHEGDVVQRTEARGHVGYLALEEGAGAGWLG